MSAQSTSDANPFPDLTGRLRAEPAPSPPGGPAPPRPSRPRVHNGSRTCFESRLAFETADADTDDPAEEFVTPTRRFSVLETTSGPPDDSRQEDERYAERQLRELRARVKVARAVVSNTPGLAEAIRADWRKAAVFYTRFGITENLFRHGVPTDPIQAADDLLEESRGPCEGFVEFRVRPTAILFVSETP